MKALTVQQPYASLIAWGEKRYETRSWSTDYRGELVIHAGKTQALTRRFTKDYHAMHGVDLPPLLHFLHDADAAHRSASVPLPFGAGLCIARIIDCVLTNHLYGAVHGTKEEFFGDWHAGRYAWQLEIVEVFAEPIPAVGKLGLWNWENKT